jgi:dinuclear metal center YbgI/SA1388 family protein
MAAAPPTLRDCIAVLEAAYDPSDAESWDAVGLVSGDPAVPVERVHFAVDPTEAVAAEAVAARAQLLVTHHPLFLRGTSSVAETAAGGRVVATLIRGGCALFAAHTNADVARPGVNDALAALFALQDTVPLRPLAPTDVWSGSELAKLVVFVPHDDRAPLLDALAAAGAGAIGAYDRCGWWTEGTGTFRPLAGANPTIGAVGAVEEVAESRLEMVVPRARSAAVLAALRAAHPYEEPAFDLLPMVDVPTPGGLRRGLGRIGDLPAPTTLGAFLDEVAARLPRTAWGVRATGDPDRPVRRVAVCGGSGGELAGAAAAGGADVFLTSDGRHHHASDAVAAHDLALVDAAHWATEWPWLASAAEVLTAGLRVSAAGRPDRTDNVAVPVTAVSELRTDPWSLHRC